MSNAKVFTPLILARGKIKRIHVNQHAIRKNRKTGQGNPVLSVKTSQGNHYGHRVEIAGDSTVVYSPDKPLSCGAHVWVETRAEIKLT